MADQTERKTAVKEKKKDRRIRKWTGSEIDTVLNYMIDTVQGGHKIEKPTALGYYTILRTKCALPSDLTAVMIRDKICNTRRQYRKAVDWEKQTGQGVLSSEGETSFKHALHKRCPNYDKCEIIWGSKVSIHVPCTSSSTQIGNPATLNGLPADDLEIVSTNANTTEQATIPSPDRCRSPISCPSPVPSEMSWLNDSQTESQIIPTPVSSPTSTAEPIVKAGVRLSRVGRKRTTQDVYEEMSLERERNSKAKLGLLERQLVLEEQKVQAAMALERKKFVFEKRKEMMRMKAEQNIVQMKADSEKELAKLRIQELKLKLQLKLAAVKNKSIIPKGDSCDSE